MKRAVRAYLQASHRPNGLLSKSVLTASRPSAAVNVPGDLRGDLAAFHKFVNNSGHTPSLFSVQGALIPGLRTIDGSSDALLDLTIRDAGSEEAWAIIGPAAEHGGAVKAEIVKALLGLTRVQTFGASGQLIHETNAHPFLQVTQTSPSQSLRLVSFSSRLSAIENEGSNAFVNFTARYGAIREDDRVTLWEDLLRDMGTKTGLVARIALVHDPLADPDAEKGQDCKEGAVNRLPCSIPQAEKEARNLARQNVAKIERLAPLLKLSSGDPPLLQRPLIALSNGQTRRARILSALCSGCDVLVLEEPFTGLDPPTRKDLSKLLGELHSRRHPRVMCVLQEQNELPEFITHILSIGEEGQILFNGPLRSLSSESASSLLMLSTHSKHRQGGYELLKKQASRGIGRGDETATPIVTMKNVSIAYKGKKLLDSISLCLPPGSTTVLVGDNGSGKTTLLSLLLGSHPQSFGMSAEALKLFGKARSEPSNATQLLLRKTGQLSPELANAFPRCSIERGGLTVQEAIGTGFEGIFVRRALSQGQEDRIRRLVELFTPALSNVPRVPGRTQCPSSPRAPEDQTGGLASSRLLSSAFSSLAPGSQAVVLFLRSIVHRPRLLILDEPFQGMSSTQVSMVRRYLDTQGDENLESQEAKEGIDLEEARKDAEWRKERAVVVVSHFEDEWPADAGRLLRLSEGRAVESV